LVSDTTFHLTADDLIVEGRHTNLWDFKAPYISRCISTYAP